MQLTEYITNYITTLKQSTVAFTEAQNTQKLSSADYYVNLLMRYEMLTHSTDAGVALEAVKHYERILTLLLQAQPEETAENTSAETNI